jgi:CheY-like chemotaxis protein
MSSEALHRILVVDDAPEIRAVARVALTKVGGYEVEVCESGMEALARVVAFAPQLILLDNRMPLMDGAATLRELRLVPSAARIPIVFFTASSDVDERLRFEEMGASGVIFKPFDPMTLAARLAEIWAGIPG